MSEKLTEGMRTALYHVGFGVRKYRDGFRSEDGGERVDGRSLRALLRRGLISWHSVGSAPQFIALDVTPEGERIFEELRIEIDRARRH